MARGKTIHFLLTYDRSERRLVNMKRFHNGREAVDAYGEREREFADRPHIEVVLLGADSERAIRVTHRDLLRGGSVAGRRCRPASLRDRSRSRLTQRAAPLRRRLRPIRGHRAGTAPCRTPSISFLGRAVAAAS